MARHRAKPRQSKTPPHSLKTPARTPDVELDAGPDSVLAVSVSAVTLLVVAVMVFFTPRMTGDTFMTIAGGQDVLDGKLGGLDDWASTTKDRVWINQSWGTGVLFHTAHRWMGYNGIVAIKALLISTLACFLVLGTWIFGVRLSVGILTSAAALSAARHFIDMRANVIGLVCLALLICVLYWSGQRRHRIWWAVGLVTIWSHMHGSFIFGIGMIGLWTLIHIGVARLTNRYTFRIIDFWPLIAGTCLAVILPAATSPLGITNLTQPFTLLPELQTEKWPIPALEMRAIFSFHNRYFSGLREYFVLLGVLLAPAIVWVLYCFELKRPFWELTDLRRTIELLFTVVLVCVAVAMAIKARRFIPVALIVATPLAAMEIQWLLRHRWFAWPTALGLPLAISVGPLLEAVSVMAAEPINPMQPVRADVRFVWTTVALVTVGLPLLILLIRPVLRQLAHAIPGLASTLVWLVDKRRIGWATSALAVLLIFVTARTMPGVARYYGTDHPFLPDHDLFRRMILYHEFPDAAAQFLSDNQLEGNVFNEWKWEGFLRMHCPQLKVFLGGRSRQVYPASAAEQFKYFSAGQNLDQLTTAGIRYLVISNKSSQLFDKVMLDTQIPWQVIYFDDNSLIAANQDDSVAQQVTQDALAGRLKFPSAESAAISLAVHCLTDKSESLSPAQIIESCEEANRLAPSPFVSALIPHAAGQNRVGYPWMISFLESELTRLESADFQHERGGHVLACRQRAAFVLSRFYASQKQDRPATFWNDYYQQLTAALAALRQSKPLPAIKPLPSQEELARIRS